MDRNELELIALHCLERIETEAKATQQGQEVKIANIERRVDDFETQLTRLSASLRSLQPLADGLNSILPNGGRR